MRRRGSSSRSTDVALVGALFLRRQLCGRQDLETLVRYRLATLDREAVGPGRQTLLGTLEGGELDTQVVGQALLQLVLIELRGQVPQVEEWIRLLAIVLVH